MRAAKQAMGSRSAAALRAASLRRLAGAVACLCFGLSLAAQRGAAPAGIQDPAWSPDGRRIAFSSLDRIWTSAPDGGKARQLRRAAPATERDPSWSPDGRFLAFSADSGDGFHIYVSPAEGGDARRLTGSDAGLGAEAPAEAAVSAEASAKADNRWPSWTHDGRVIFSRRDGWRWRLLVVPSTGGAATPLFPDSASDDEREGRVSPDGKRVAFVSDRESEDGDHDVWVADLAASGARPRRTRVVRARGLERFPSWSPDGSRIAFYAVREGIGSVWVAPVDVRGTDAAAAPRPRPAEQPVLASRHGGMPAWSPDGRLLAIGELPQPDPAYNGNPLRSLQEPPPLFAGGAFRLWIVDAPVPVDSGAREIAAATAPAGSFAEAFDRVWDMLRRLYYIDGPSAPRWRELKDTYRPQAAAARDEAALESAVDAMIAEQPLIKPAVTSNRAVVVSGHPLASRAGAMALEQGGNIVDAAIAVSFALGVVEPDASGIGGDGMALVWLKGMSEPVAIDYKDQVPIKATRDNPVLQQSTGDGPAAANIPGVVAGLDHMFRRYGSGKIAWKDLVAPAIAYADEGFALDESLPTSIAVGRRFFEKYPESRRIYLPGGKVPGPGDRFVNKDYAATLRAIANEGAQTFYRGAIARRIAEDMARHGGLIGLDDLAQYRAIERRPLAGRYRDHVVYSSPPPVSTGLGLIETLQILQNYQPRPGASYATDADYLHHAIEAWKVRDPQPRVADPALFEVDLGSHLDAAHAAALFKKIDPAKASRYPIDPEGRGGRGGRGAGPGSGSPGGADPPERIGRGTTAFAVADADGNMIAVTQTLSTWGGTFYVSEGLGFLYNNHLRFGGTGGAPGRFLPLARSSSTSVPTLVFTKQGETLSSRLAVAAAGNAWIPASVYDIILNVVDSGMPAQKAIEAPRFLIGRDPIEPEAGRMQIEDRFPRGILQDLISRGHRFQKIGRKGEVRYGYAAAVVVDPAARVVEGGAEPRRSHVAAAPR